MLQISDFCFFCLSGSGKTSYCRKMKEYLSNKFGLENVKVVNLDPGNDVLPFKVDVDISELITVSDVMDRLKLGPNGALLYCMDFIEENFDEFLIKQIESAVENANTKQPCWILFDMPGQVSNVNNFCCQILIHDLW